MKAINLKLSVIALLTLMFAIGLQTSVSAQTTTWTYEAGDNSGSMMQIIENGNGVSKLNLGKKGDAAWTTTTIQSINGNEDYIRVKSTKSGRVYEINVDWYNDKAVLTRPEGTKVTYWLRKS